jgi:hypothetical protein
MIVKRFYLTVIIPALLSCHFLGAQYIFKDSISGFTASFPATFECDTVPFPLETEIIYHTVCTCSIGDKGPAIKYTLMLASYPDEIFIKESDEFLTSFWEETIKASAQSVLGEIVYQDIRQEPIGSQAVWRISYDKGKGVIKSKAFVRTRYFAAVKVDFPYDKRHTNQMDDFLNSFKAL